MPPRYDEPLFLGRSGGLTRNPAQAMRTDRRIEPEPVVGEDLERFAQAARRDQAVARELTLAALAAAPLDSRIARCRAQAKALSVDVHGELRLVRLAVRNGRSRDHVSRRLAVLEARLWPHLDGAT